MNKKGQSLIELLIAMGVFALAVSVITWLILDVYLADRAGRERMIATFLVKEGMAAVRSIRDNNWSDLIEGDHGLAISGSNWVFQGSQENVSSHLREGIRRITVENIDPDRKKITSQITWTLTETRSQDVSLITYLTNWAKTTALESCASHCQSIGYSDGTCRRNPMRCLFNGETHEAGGDQYCTENPQADTCCCSP